MRRGVYVENGLRTGDISRRTVLFDIGQGRVTGSFQPNDIPERAIDEVKGMPRGEGKIQQSINGLYRSGVGRVNWSRVVSASKEEIQAFRKTHKLLEMLVGNTKTDKPRADTSRSGEIVGLALSPHYYPNLLNVIAVEKNGRLAQIPKEDFNAFNGRTLQTALETCGDGKIHLKAANALNFCVGSSPACRVTCLVGTGNNPASHEAQNAKMKMTFAFLSDPEMFVACLRRELHLFTNGAIKNGLDPVVRLNMLSDIPWYEVCPELIEELEGKCFFYDYTKIKFWESEAWNRLWRVDDLGRRYNLLDLTFSYSGTNESECVEALRNGYRVAAVFVSSNPLRTGTPSLTSTEAGSISGRTTYQEILLSSLSDGHGNVHLFGGTYPLIDGDESDFRLDDPGKGPGTEPCIVALNFKESSIFKSESTKPSPGLVKRLGREEAQRYAERTRARYAKRYEDFGPARGQFSVEVPETPEGLAYSTALSRGAWDTRVGEDFDKYAAAPHDLVEIDDVWLAARKEASRQKLDEEAAEAYARSAARARARSLGYVANPSFDSYVEGNGPQMPMSPIAGTTLLIGPHVPTVAAD